MARRANIYVTKASRLVRVPDNLDLERAAGLSVTYGTTIHALKDRAKLKTGETLAVLGAAGGTGLAAIEIGKLMGARVIACASSDEKCDFAKKHGADETVNYGRDDLRSELKRHRRRAWHRRDLRSDRRPLCRARAPLDGVEGPLSGDRICGRRNSENPAQPRAAERLRHCRRALGRLRRARAGEAGAAKWREIVRWCAEGKLSAHVHAVYPLSETAQALKDIAARKIMGKAILKP